MRALTTDMAQRELRPYFLWDEDVSIDELHQVLAGPDSPRRDQLLSEVTIPDGVVLPAGVSPAELRAYVAELIARLLTLAAPR